MPMAPKNTDETTRVLKGVVSEAIADEMRRREMLPDEKPTRIGYWKPAINGLVVSALMAAAGAGWGVLHQRERIDELQNALRSTQAKLDSFHNYPPDADRFAQTILMQADQSAVRVLGERISAMSREIAALTTQITELTRRLDRYELTKNAP